MKHKSKGPFKVKIIVGFHKPYRMPTDKMYLPLRLGAALEEDESDTRFGKVGASYERDDTGDNISDLNRTFCELTGLYWAWKNVDADYIGLVHYRRYFRGRRKKNLSMSILKYEDIKDKLGTVKIFLPPKRRYFIETLYSHYAHTHEADHLKITRAVLAKKYPQYLPSCDRVYRRRSGYMFNMMIMEKELLDEYCNWLFDVLFILKDKISTEGLSDYQRRIFGRISEILNNIWLDHQIEIGRIKKENIRELPLVYMEKPKWGEKIPAFLKAKLLGVKYTRSF